MFCLLSEIVKLQEDYFLRGGDLRPMTMAQLAEVMEVNVSTVSRAVKGKYADFDGNIIAIKDMFSLKASRQDQDAKSADMIKKFIQRQIAQEDKRSPLSDQQLCSSLAENGVNISRRLVAKYREGLGIPSSMRRKMQSGMIRSAFFLRIDSAALYSE